MARTPNTEDIEAIKACVQKYIDGSARGDRALLAEAFHPNAQMYGYFAGNLMAVPIGEFFSLLKIDGQWKIVNKTFHGRPSTPTQ